MIVSGIVAVDKSGLIGRNNEIPWYLPADLKLFKRITLNHNVIMGRNTFQSIGRPLPKRTNIVLTRDLFFTASGVVIAHSLDEALQVAKDNGESEVFIIGGAQIYRLSIPLLDRLYISEVQATFEGDTFFPQVDLTNWNLVKEELFPADEKNTFDFVFKKYIK